MRKNRKKIVSIIKTRWKIKEDKGGREGRKRNKGKKRKRRKDG